MAISNQGCAQEAHRIRAGCGSAKSVNKVLREEQRSRTSEYNAGNTLGHPLLFVITLYPLCITQICEYVLDDTSGVSYARLSSLRKRKSVH